MQSNKLFLGIITYLVKKKIDLFTFREAIKMEKSTSSSICPICDRDFPSITIEAHVNKCIFLNSSESKLQPERINARKRSVSPTVESTPSKTQKSSTAESAVVQKPQILDFTVPLAKQIEPKTLDEFFGQLKVLGQDSVLRQLLEKGEIPNMILWGPPGCGKTSLSSVIREICKRHSNRLRFQSLCAANCGVKEVGTIVGDAKMQQKFGKQTVLFMDEVHRFNKKQQDVFLLHVERGDIILVGATTENPSFSLNNALLSRCRVIVMEKLDVTSMESLIERALKKFNVHIVDDLKMKVTQLSIEKNALKWLAETCDGDARIALSNLQLILQQSSRKSLLISTEDIKEDLKKSHLLYDRRGEEHYNIISAMHKSIRGSDANAALYWTTRMISAGEDPLFIARRLVRAASEDIGNADPNALQLAVSTMQGCQLIGMPECDVLLAQCAIYLARAPKSREADAALAEAKQLIARCKGPQPDVPMHIRNAPTKLMKELGYGRHDGEGEKSFMPKGLEHVRFFK